MSASSSKVKDDSSVGLNLMRPTGHRLTDHFMKNFKQIIQNTQNKYKLSKAASVDGKSNKDEKSLDNEVAGSI